MEHTIVRTRRRVFKPRVLPRNKYDWRIMAILYPLAFAIILPLAFLWLTIPMILTMRLLDSPSAVLLVLLMQWALWMGFFLYPIVNRVEVDEEGLYVPGLIRTQRIAWEDIESVRVVTRGEVLKASLRWPFKDPSLRFSNSPFTFSEYIRIRHKHGTLYYAAQDTEELLTLLLTRRSTPVTTARWYTVPTITPARDEVPLHHQL